MKGTLIYRFDNTEAFGLIETEGAARSAVSLRLGGTEQERFLRVQWERGSVDAAEVEIVLALPPRAVAGKLDQWLLDVCGGTGGCGITLEAGDCYGAGLEYAFGIAGGAAPGVLSAPVADPTAIRGERCETREEPVTPPVEPYRLRLSPPEGCQALDIGLRTLRVTGDVRLAAPGIA